MLFMVLLFILFYFVGVIIVFRNIFLLKNTLKIPMKIIGLFKDNQRPHLDKYTHGIGEFVYLSKTYRFKTDVPSKKNLNSYAYIINNDPSTVSTYNSWINTTGIILILIGLGFPLFLFLFLPKEIIGWISVLLLYFSYMVWERKNKIHKMTLTETPFEENEDGSLGFDINDVYFTPIESIEKYN